MNKLLELGLEHDTRLISTIYFDEISYTLLDEIKLDNRVVKIKKDDLRGIANVGNIQLRNVTDVMYRGVASFDRCLEKYKTFDHEANAFIIRDDHPDYAWILLQAK